MCAPLVELNLNDYRVKLNIYFQVALGLPEVSFSPALNAHDYVDAISRLTETPHIAIYQHGKIYVCSEEWYLIFLLFLKMID